MSLQKMMSSTRRRVEATATSARGAERVKVVYIAGTSFSGSTLLGLILGTDRDAIFVGEANQSTLHWNRNDGVRRECTCGEPIDNCSFWSAVRRRHAPEVDLNPAPGLSLLNLRHVLRLLSPFPVTKRSGTVTPYGSLLGAIGEVARTEKPGVELIIDSSKSIHNLDALARSSNIELAVVHLIRNCAAVADSYKDRGRSAAYGIVVWGLMNACVRLYAWRHGIRLITVDYQALCSSTEAELARLNRSLGMSLVADDLAAKIRTAGYHVFAGNKRVRVGRREFSRIEYRADVRRLGRFERHAASLVQRVASAVLRTTPPGTR